MGSTNKTTKLQLSQFVDADKPTWRGDYNGDMLAIDNGLVAVDSAVATVAASASAALAVANGANNAAETASDKADAVDTRVTALTGTVGELDDRVDGVVASVTALTDKVNRDAEFLNVLSYGAKGDWNGTSGTDNLSAFNAVSAAILSSPGPKVIYVPRGDYWLSDTWLIDAEDVSVVCDPAATIRTTRATTIGGVVGFMGWGPEQPPGPPPTGNTNTAPQRHRCSWIGGKVIATGSGNLDNGIGVVRYKNSYIADVTVDADRKGITAQYGIDNIVWERIEVLRGATDGISVETYCKRVRISDVYIAQCGIGVRFTANADTSDKRNQDVVLENVYIPNAGSTGVQLALTDRATLRNVQANSATTGLNIAAVTNLSIDEACRFSSVASDAASTWALPFSAPVVPQGAWTVVGSDPLPRAYHDGGFTAIDGVLGGGSIDGTSKNICQIPAAFRPKKVVRAIALASNGAGQTVPVYVTIDTNGNMTWNATSLPTSGVLVLTGIRYPRSAV